MCSAGVYILYVQVESSVHIQVCRVHIQVCGVQVEVCGVQVNVYVSR